MSNLSLKEQLQASLGLSSSSIKKENKPIAKKQIPSGKSAKQKPAWLEYAQYGVELLKAHFPTCFKEPNEIQPLKVGIKHDLAKALSSREDIVIGDKACMVSSLAYYVSSSAYHKTVLEGASRIDLSGQSVGIVSAEEARYSTECRQAKLQKKKPGQANKTHQEEAANS